MGGAMPNPTARIRACAIALALFASPAHSQDDTISSAIKYCRGNRNAVTLSGDKHILCFDGIIRENVDAGPFYDLKPNGIFVVRSLGGFAEPTMRIANILRDKNAKVLIHDYCLSACANWILVAANETYVARNTIIAWHGGPTRPNTAFQFADPMTGLHLDSRVSCRLPDEDMVVIDEKIAASMKSGSKNQMQERINEINRSACKRFELHRAFFKSRGTEDRHICEPQTEQTKDMYDEAVKTHGRQSTSWMWNPRNHKNYFKTNIVYESYPASQSEVDEMLRTLRLPIRVIYDP
jgi:hypothetical protein